MLQWNRDITRTTH